MMNLAPATAIYVLFVVYAAFQANKVVYIYIIVFQNFIMEMFWDWFCIQLIICEHSAERNILASLY